ncbi:hypothetical protein [Acinetobacter sp. RF14B]|uniref:hypothetical protein n=1 Tax=Acinetobacter sp. RF14B TaxID=2650965 RepID=UPI0011717B9C|nr:hypothetical protein [Acinetobacter sp. RF14B]TQR68161.1 hypothetical protein E2K52_04750 [Acinetobacter sp. RF14B]
MLFAYPKAASSLGLFTALLFSLSACTSPLSSSQIDREAYLQSLIGQSSEQIDQNLDLKRLGYQQISGPHLSGQQLSYIVQRPLTIPLPIAQFPAAGTGAVPIPTNISPVTGYDVNLQCKISFLLKNNIATAVRTTGRTC